MRKAKLFIFYLLVMTIMTGCSSKPPMTKRIHLVVWQPFGEAEWMKGTWAAIHSFEKRNPGIKVDLVPLGGGMNPQKLMTAIAAGCPPDVIVQDRFSVPQWASRDAFLPLDRLIKRDKINPKDYYPACWNEAIYNGKVYAIPYITDDRALYWNKKLFREAGMNPERPPKNWDELLSYALRLTKTDAQGRIERLGFIPMYGNSWLYLYSWQNGGEFMNSDRTKCTLNNPKTTEALQWIVSVYDALGGAETVNGFAQSFGVEVMHPLFTDKLAMVIDGNWFLYYIARYKPDLDFGVAPAPPPKGKPFITWSGGFSMAIPRGARKVELSWKFIKFMTSKEAWIIANRAQRDYNRKKGKPFVPNMSANVEADRIIFDKFAPKEPKLRKALKTFMDLMSVSRFRPVTPVAQELWDWHVRATENAIYHKKTPKEALDEATAHVQEELDKILKKPQYPRLNLPMISYISMELFVLAIAFLYFLVSRSVKGHKLAKLEALAGYLFASPWFIGLLVFTAGPIIASIILSFCDYDVLHPAGFAGLKNYIYLLTKEKLFWKSLGNTAFMLLGIPIGIIISLGIALLLNAELKGIAIYRTAYYLPSIVPLVAVCILWLWLLNPEAGLINAGLAKLNSIFNALGLGKYGLQLPLPKWLGTETWSKPSLIFMGLWGVGGSMIIWLAGLKSIPEHLYEAAEIDGANWWHKFRYVTIPMLTPYIFFNLIMGTIGTFKIFEQSYIMTQGGPVDSTLFYVYYLFNNAFQYFKMGYACAMAWLLFIVILLLTLLQFKIAPMWVHYEAERR